MCFLAASGRFVIRFHRARVGFHADAVGGNETRPIHMVNQIDVLDDADLRSRTLEQGDACLLYTSDAADDLLTV